MEKIDGANQKIDYYKYNGIYEKLNSLLHDIVNDALKEPIPTQPTKKELFENNLNDPLIASYCYDQLYQIDKERAMQLMEQNLQNFSNIFRKILEMNWVRDFNSSGIRLVLETYHQFDQEEESSADSCLKIIMGDCHYEVKLEKGIDRYIDNYLMKNCGNNTFFERSFQEDMNIYYKNFGAIK